MRMHGRLQWPERESLREARFKTYELRPIRHADGEGTSVELQVNKYKYSLEVRQ